MGPPEHGSAPHPHFTPNKLYSHLVKGSKVEVTSKDEGFVGSWFEATVIKPPEIPNSRSRDKRITLVEYANLLNDDASLLLREQVDAVMLRPVPPGTEVDGGFEVGDVVDAFEKDGWWTGVVDRVVKEEGEEVRYVVSFADPKHEIEFGKDSMRLHLDWINGNWFRCWNGKTQQNKESNHHITSTSMRSITRVLELKGAKEGQGEVSKADDVQKDLSLEEQLTEAVGTGFSLQEHLTRAVGAEVSLQEQLTGAVGAEVSLQEQLTEADGAELALAKQGEAPIADSADNNPHVRELTLVDVRTELKPKEQGHSDPVNDERTSPVTEGTMVVLNEQNQSDPNDVSAIGPSLPFRRTSPIWKTVESLEIFRKFPQQPHFFPLIDAREIFREGLAIAKMITFASTAEKAINSSIDDTICCITACLETLQGLELYGFNAKTLKMRLEKLVSLKKMQQKIDEEKNGLKGQVSELKHVIVEVKEEIYEAVSMIKFYQDKLESALLKEEEKGLEILAFETSMDVLDTVISNALLDFEDSDTW